MRQSGLETFLKEYDNFIKEQRNFHSWKEQLHFGRLGKRHTSHMDFFWYFSRRFCQI